MNNKLSQMPNHYKRVLCSGCVSCVALGYEDKKSSLKRQHNFIRDDRLYEGSETSYAKKCGGLTKDFE